MAFVCIAVLAFIAAATATCVSGVSMASMDAMTMPGGWSMSMAWMRMPGQSWPGAAAAFIGMWVVMMIAMMLPSLVPMLARYRQAVRGDAPLGRLTAIVAAAYFVVWTAIGIAAYPLGVAMSAAAMEFEAVARTVPFAVGLLVSIAGLLQFSAWKSRQLACCRESPDSTRTLPPDAPTAFRHGLSLGLSCARCCAGMTAILLVVGVMDLRAMALVTVAISLERLAPAGQRVAKILGAVITGAGIFLIVQAA